MASKIFFEDSDFDGQFLRILGTAYYGGCDIGECFAAARQMTAGDFTSWESVWTATAKRLAGVAASSQAAGHRQSAREAYLRAAGYARIAGAFSYRPDAVARLKASFDLQRAYFGRATALFDAPVETVAIDFESVPLPGYFFKVDDSREPRPLLIVTCGYDSVAEESWPTTVVPALRRGYQALVFEGPGQGSPLVDQHRFFRPDWESVVRPVVDYALARDDVDPTRVVLVGRSFGGYLAPRAATAEHRVAALIADAVQYAPGAQFRAMLPAPLQAALDGGDFGPVNATLAPMLQQASFKFMADRGMLTHNVDSTAAYMKALEPFSLEGRAPAIDCPTFLCDAEDDTRGTTGQRLYDALTVKSKRYVEFTADQGAGDHCESGAGGLFAQVVFDWLDETLA